MLVKRTPELTGQGYSPAKAEVEGWEILHAPACCLIPPGASGAFLGLPACGLGWGRQESCWCIPQMALGICLRESGPPSTGVPCAPSRLYQPSTVPGFCAVKCFLSHQLAGTWASPQDLEAWVHLLSWEAMRGDRPGGSRRCHPFPGDVGVSLQCPPGLWWWNAGHAGVEGSGRSRVVVGQDPMVGGCLMGMCTPTLC